MPPRYRPLTLDAAVEDFFLFFDQLAYRDHPEWGCNALLPLLPHHDKAVWDSKTPKDNAADAREMILRGQLRGMLAYVDGFHRLVPHRPTKHLPGAASPEYASPAPQDGAAVCFTVAQGYRRQGVATGLAESGASRSVIHAA